MPKPTRPGARKANGRYKIAPRPAAPIDAVARYDMRETCSYLRVSKASIYKLFQSGALEPSRERKRVFVQGRELIRFLQA
jgi:hypothetical protein